MLCRRMVSAQSFGPEKACEAVLVAEEATLPNTMKIRVPRHIGLFEVLLSIFLTLLNGLVLGMFF